MSMARTLLTAFGLTLAVGCTMHSQGSSGDTQTLRTPDPQALAYQKVLQAVVLEGGALQQTIEPKLISARFHGGITLSVIVQPTTDGSSLTALAKLDAGKVAFGGVTVADAVLRRYHEVQF